MIYWILALQLFLSPSDPRLHKPVPAMCSCSIKSRQTQKNIDILSEVAFKEKLESLSAPQIGIFQRIIVIDQKAYINPEILHNSGGCVLLRAYDRDAKIVTIELIGKEAHLAQYEIDHLDGKY